MSPSFRNKKTGEIIEIAPSPTTDKKENAASDIYTQRYGEAQQRIEGRGNLWGNIRGDISSPNPIRKAVGLIGAVASPASVAESAIANPALEMQSGNFRPQDLAREAALGLSGRKQGQFGDVYRVAGAPAPIAASAGLLLSAAGPIKVLKSAGNAFGKIAKLSDRGIVKAGESLINATKEAKKFTGASLGEAFKPVEGAKVDPNRFISEIADLPKPLVAKLESIFGPLTDVGQNMTIGTLRKIKQTIGKYNPGVFGREARGLSENITADEINKVYRAIKKLIGETIENTSGKETAKKLMSLEDSYTAVERAADFVKRSVMDSTLRLPTKGGKVAKQLNLEGDVSGRSALNTLRSAGVNAKKEIDRAVSELDKFNKWRAVSSVSKRVLEAGAIGITAGKAARSFNQGGGD